MSLFIIMKTDILLAVEVTHLSHRKARAGPHRLQFSDVAHVTRTWNKNSGRPTKRLV